MEFFNFPLLGDLFVLPRQRYVIQIVFGVGAFASAMNSENTWGRITGLAFLIIIGVVFGLAGLTGAIGDLLLGLVAIGGAVYAWWYHQM
ncbi:MAG: hypothetical protein ACSHYB_09465 [Roseibacillus sp.]